MDLEWLEDFQTLAEAGNFSRSAELRNTTQSALSRRIQALEVWVGAKLVDRSTYPIQLTEAGTVFLQTSSDVVQRLTAARLRASMAAGRMDEPVILATSHAVALELFPPWLSGVERDFKRFPSRLEYHVVERCFSLLDKKAAHFVVCPTLEAPAGDGSKYPSLVFGADEMTPVSVPDADGAPRFKLPGSRSRPIPFLSVSPDAMLGGAVRRLLTEHRPAASVNVCFESPQKGAVQQMALAGKGIAWLPRATVAADLASGALVVAGTPDWVVPFEIRLYRAAGPLPPLAESLWRCLERGADTSGQGAALAHA